MSGFRKLLIASAGAVTLAFGISASTPASAFHYYGPGWGWGGWGGWGWGGGPAVAAGLGGLFTGAALGTAAAYPGYWGGGYPYTTIGYGGCPVRHYGCYRRVRYCY